MTWEKLPPLKPYYGPRPATFPAENVIAVGFGYAALHKNGAPVWSEVDAADDDGLMTGAEAEALAAQDPDHDWRIVLHGPLSGRTYQRHGPGEWVLVEKNKGFA